MCFSPTKQCFESCNKLCKLAPALVASDLSKLPGPGARFAKPKLGGSFSVMASKP